MTADSANSSAINVRRVLWAALKHVKSWRVTMPVFKRREFARWQVREKIPDAMLCVAVNEMERGLIDADLGGALYKKRIARQGSGKSSGYRTLLAARVGERYVFLHGFAKNEQSNVTLGEKKALQYAGRVFLALSSEALAVAIKSGVLLEVNCEQHH